MHGHRKLVSSINLCFRHIDDLIAFNNKKFWEHVKDTYPSQLHVEKNNRSDNLASYLDLKFTIKKDWKLCNKLYDKRDDFDFHIVNFLFLSSNIPSGPSYGLTSRSSLDMQDSAHTMMILNIAIKCFCLVRKLHRICRTIFSSFFRVCHFDYMLVHCGC